MLGKCLDENYARLIVLQESLSIHLVALDYIELFISVLSTLVAASDVLLK